MTTDILTPGDYPNYQAAVADFFESERLISLTTNAECSEPYFSWQPCDCCGGSLGGNRVDTHGYNPTTKTIQGPYLICEDCQYYVAYGQLDDATMDRINQ